jgi:hypothetical protein
MRGTKFMPEHNARSMLKSIAIPFLGGVVGSIAALLAAIVADLADVLFEAKTQVSALSWEMGLFIVPVMATIGGLPVGFLGALIGRRWIGGVVGAVALGGMAMFMFGIPAGPRMATGVATLLVGILSGFAAGAAGGTVTERYERRSANSQCGTT